MADIPRHFRQRKLAGGAGVTRAHPYDIHRMTRTGRPEMYRAIGGFGAALKGVSDKTAEEFYKTKVGMQTTESKAAWERGHSQFMKDLAQDQDYEGYEAKYKAFSKSLRRQIIDKNKNLTKGAKDELTNYMTLDGARKHNDVLATYLGKHSDYGAASLIESVTAFERAGKATEAETAIDKGVENGFISAEAGAKLKLNIGRNVELNQAHELIALNPADFIVAIEDDLDPAVDFDFMNNLSIQEKMQLMGKARTEIGRQQAQFQAYEKAMINKEQGRLMRLSRTGELSDEEIRTSQLPEFGTGSRKTFYDILDAEAAAGLEQDEEIREEMLRPFKESNPKIKAQILELIRAGEIDEQGIADFVGKGLSTDNADTMISKMDVFKSHWFKDADKYLKNSLGWSDTYTKFMRPEAGLYYDLALNDLYDAIETEGLRGRELSLRGREIANPYLLDYYREILMVGPSKMELITELLRGEGVELETEKPKKRGRKPAVKTSDALDPEGIWK